MKEIPELSDVKCITPQDLESSYLETGYSCRLSDPLTSMVHCHSFYELIYCIAGSCTHVVNNKKYPFYEGSIFIVPPRSVHYFVDFYATTALTICISPEKFEFFLKAFSLSHDPCYKDGNAPFFLEISSAEKPFFHNLYSQIMSHPPLDRTPYFNLFLAHTLSCKIQQTLPKQPISSTFLKALAKMKTLPNAREGMPAFLRLANVSHSHLCRLSRQHLGMSPQEYITGIRLQYAHDIISEESVPFEEVAEMVGFSSYPHFCQLFKKYYNISPSMLRKQSHPR